MYNKNMKKIKYKYKVGDKVELITGEVGRIDTKFDIAEMVIDRSGPAYFVTTKDAKHDLKRIAHEHHIKRVIKRARK